MVTFTACFVVLDNDDESIRYMTHTMYGARIPVQSTKDIIDMCTTINNTDLSKHRCVDVFMVMDQEGNTVWEEGLQTNSGERQSLSVRG